jgi:hypothetical protein
MGRLASAALAARWRERIDRWRSSGLSVAEFCRREGISEPSFFAWRKRLAGRRAKSPVRRQAKSPRFVELPPLAWSAMAGVQIALPGGAIVTLSPQATTELVTAAIRAAMPAPAAEVRPC